jgi:uncharacterized cupredoxin-like copper-binding protein
MSLFHPRSLVPLAALLAACATKDAPRSAGTAADTTHAVAVAPHQMTIIATDYKFDAPDQVRAGFTNVHLIDNGTEMHHVAFVRLNDGKSLADIEQAMKTQGPLPSWAMDAGGVNAPRPGGGMASATQMLEPGAYALICFIPSPDGVPHFAKGMVRSLTVVPDSGAAAAVPAADITMTLNDYTFTASKPITAGVHTIKVENDAAQSHELLLVRLASGKKAEDVPSWAEKPIGPPPGEPIGGVPAMAHGGSAFITVDFTPGDYALICFLRDAKDGKPHYAHGMVQQLHVD